MTGFWNGLVSALMAVLLLLLIVSVGKYLAYEDWAPKKDWEWASEEPWPPPPSRNRASKKAPAKGECRKVYGKPRAKRVGDWVFVERPWVMVDCD